MSPLRVLVVLAVTAGLSWTGARAVSALVTAPPDPADSVFAGYVDATLTPRYAFETPAGPAQSSVVLAFVVADPADGCAPSWGGYYSLDDAAAELQLDRRLSQLRSTGGDARVSFGGQRGPELAVTCRDEERLAEAYGAVVERYELTHIDLDIEGEALEDRQASVRRAAAVAAVQETAREADRPLSVWLTLPVSPTGLTEAGRGVVADMLAAGVDVGGVNAMTMNLGVPTSPTAPMAVTVLEAARAVHGQVLELWSDAGQRLDGTQAWARVGITPMIGQNDIQTEVFTLEDAAVVNEFAREHGVGFVSLWSLNRDATCGPPLPSVLPVVQNGCSGVQQDGQRFADVLAEGLSGTVPARTPVVREAPSPRPSAPAPAQPVDDPETSPFPIWDPLGTYPGGQKVVWRQQVYEARYWTTGVAPDTPVANAFDSPWTLLGPVLPTDRPAPLPTLPAGSYPEWDPEREYVAGSRVQLGLVPYEAKWWTQGQEPGTTVPGGSPWVLVFPAG